MDYLRPKYHTAKGIPVKKHFLFMKGGTGDFMPMLGAISVAFLPAASVEYLERENGHYYLLQKCPFSVRNGSPGQTPFDSAQGKLTFDFVMSATFLSLRQPLISRSLIAASFFSRNCSEYKRSALCCFMRCFRSVVIPV